jgi:hypothetical protein
LHLLALKLPKTSFFDSKILDKIYFRDGFWGVNEFYIFCYFRRCGLIPVPSFGSHICPQPSGLGLNDFIIYIAFLSE